MFYIYELVSGIKFYEHVTKAIKEHYNPTSFIEFHIIFNQTIEATKPRLAHLSNYYESYFLLIVVFIGFHMDSLLI